MPVDLLGAPQDYRAYGLGHTSSLILGPLLSAPTFHKSVLSPAAHMVHACHQGDE